MPAAEPNKALRLAVPIVVALLGVLVVIGVFMASQPSPRPQAQAEEQPTEQIEEATEEPAEAEPETIAAAPEAQPEIPETAEVDASEIAPGPAPRETEAVEPAEPDAEPDASAAELTDLRARPQPVAEELPTLGSADPDSDFPLLLAFTQEGAGVEAIVLSSYAETLGADERYAIQERTTLTTPGGQAFTVAALAARGVRINGEFIDLFGSPEAPVWRPTGPGAFEAIIETAEGEPIARATRRFAIDAESYDISIDQRLENLSGGPLEYQWIQYGPVDLPEDEASYLRDPRRVWFGRLLSTQDDPSRQIVERTDIRSRQSVIDAETRLLWPPPAAPPGAEELVFASLSNRYFAFAVHPRIPEAALASGGPIDKRFESAEQVYRILLQGAPAPNLPPTTRLVLELHSPTRTLEAGATDDLSLAAYAGPLSRKTLGAEPIYESLGLDELIVYNIGGPCAFCTFQPLARGLLWFLSIFHDYIVFDWALAIMVLVVFVRGVLHPITKKSQIRMQRFGKQMQAIAPKQKKLQEKYKDDPKKLQQEMARLMREEGVDFTGALGCLPMFLQTPIWIALYAMLYYAFDLRHEAAYFGVFQQITGGDWNFLADLSAPDRFIDFGQSIITLPLLGEISSLNILPLILGVVFFIQQKYLTPPPSASLSPEQQTQQKIMKVVFVVMFPLFMYQAPSGLTIYFITNSTLGILESRYIRAHIENLPEPEPKKPRPRKTGPGAPQKPRKRVLNEKATGFKERRKKR
jgi:YidC/Oxa1 family membrane protein insertase